MGTSGSGCQFCPPSVVATRLDSFRPMSACAVAAVSDQKFDGVTSFQCCPPSALPNVPWAVATNSAPATCDPRLDGTPARTAGTFVSWPQVKPQSDERHTSIDVTSPVPPTMALPRQRTPDESIPSPQANGQLPSQLVNSGSE